MPEVDVRLQPVVVEQAEALERLQEGPGGDPQGRLDLDPLFVVRHLPGLGDRVDEIGRGDLLAVVEWRLEILAVVVGDLAHRGDAGADRRPGVRRGIPQHGVLGNLERAVGSGGFGLEAGAEGDRQSAEGVTDDRRVDQILVDVARVGVAEATDRVPDRAIGPDPEVADPDLLRAGDAGLAQAQCRLGTADDVDVQVLQLVSGGEALQRGGQPEADTLAETHAGHLAIELVALVLAAELAAIELLTDAVQLLVLVLPESGLAASRACCRATARTSG